MSTKDGSTVDGGVFGDLVARAFAPKQRPTRTVAPVALLQDTLVFVDGVLFTECCAAEVTPTHMTISVPLRPGCEDVLRAAVEIRVCVSVRLDPNSPERTTLLDHVARGYKLDRVGYRVGGGERNSSFWVADVRFVKPLSAVRSSDDGIAAESAAPTKPPT